ncbi:hypothetical protein XaC1_541 [Xanthomonas phage XaC1]|nr:hypothetical protein XaC1_541 [Xanthomonas phage XaC1]
MSRYRIFNEDIKVKIFNSEYELFCEQAEVKAKKYQNIARSKSPYGFNTAHSHIVGLVTEYAALLMFKGIEETNGIELNIDPVFQDNTRDSQCDIVVNNLRIEVKGIKYKSWVEYGPCISNIQYDRLLKKADVVLWALYNERQQEVTFKGFNRVSDISTLRPVLTGPEGKQILNYKVLDLVKPLKELNI